MFNNTSRYLYDIFTIDNPEFEKHILDIYLSELQLNKANTSDKAKSFLDLNIKVFWQWGSYQSVRGFLIVDFLWLSVDVPRLLSYGVYISHLVTFARCCTGVTDFNSKNRQITSKLFTKGYKYHKLRKSIWKVFQVILWPFVKIWWNIFSRICIGRNSSPCLLLWSNLQTKKGQTWSIFRLIGR